MTLRGRELTNGPKCLQANANDFDHALVVGGWSSMKTWLQRPTQKPWTMKPWKYWLMAYEIMQIVSWVGFRPLYTAIIKVLVPAPLNFGQLDSLSGDKMKPDSLWDKCMLSYVLCQLRHVTFCCIRSWSCMLCCVCQAWKIGEKHPNGKRHDHSLNSSMPSSFRLETATNFKIHQHQNPSSKSSLVTPIRHILSDIWDFTAPNDPRCV